MCSPVRLLWFVVALLVSFAAQADSASILNQAKSANATRYDFAVGKNAEIRNTTDNKAFSIWWQPSTSVPTGVIVTLHGHGSYATDEFYLWQPYLQSRGYAILALQWWFGGGETTADYYQPEEMYPLTPRQHHVGPAIGLHHVARFVGDDRLLVHVSPGSCKQKQ